MGGNGSLKWVGIIHRNMWESFTQTYWNHS